MALSPVQTPPPLISISELQKEFDANVLTTMNKYEGQYPQLTGQVQKVGQEILGYPYIPLRSGDNRGVTCRFPTDLTSRVASVTVGERIVITARFNPTIFSRNFDRCTLP
ncbi:MAG: tRNA anti-like [Chloroflexi bacterium]|nr:MAG: tRNA anti-like [Chloroflexota bacterium]